MAHLPADYSPLRPSRIGVLADDLTGACDTALQYFLGATGTPAASEVWVIPELSERASVPPGAAVAAVNVDSRHLLPSEAALRVDRAARFLERGGCNRFYKKIDSTLRGNLTVEILQTLQTLGLELALLAPAFPQAGRVTVGGYQLVDSLPVNASAYARDPLNPVKHSHLPTLLAEEGTDAAYVTLREVMRGPEAVAAAIVTAIAQRRRILVADAARPEDLVAMGRAMALTPYRVLPVGSAGLARALQPHLLMDGGRQRAGDMPLLGGRLPVLVVAGSLNPVTRDQVERMKQRPKVQVVEIDVSAFLLQEAAAAERLGRVVRTLLAGSHDVVLVSGRHDDAVRRGRALGRDLGLGALQVGMHLAAAVGRVAAQVAADTPLAGIVLAGGDTALGTCRALGGGALRIIGELAPAVPLCRLEGVPGGPLRIVTKSGGFGGPELLGHLADALRRTPD